MKLQKSKHTTKKTMKISITKGHLTTLDKKVIKQMLLNKMMQGSYKKRNYFLCFSNGSYKLKQVRKEWDCDFMRNKKVNKVYYSEFKVI